MNATEGTNYYEILEVAPDAPPHEIHKAYQRAKSTYSSDNPALYSMFSADEAKELLRLVEEAFTVLGNPGLRRSYDEARDRGEKSPSLSANAPQSQSYQQASPGHGGGHASGQSMQSSSAPSNPYAAPPQHMPTQMPPQVAQAVQSALPDFALPDHSLESQSSSSGGARREAPRTNSPLPLGMGRTQLSTYKIDEAFEAELSAATDFDGNLLQRTRLYKNVSIDRLSEATRISRAYLMALETNNYKELPAAVFTRGFVVQVSRIYGLADQKVASSYIKLFKAGGGK